MKKLSLIGVLAAFAALAAMAVGATAASAREFRVSEAPTKITDKGGKQVFKTPGGTVECEQETSEGEAKLVREETTEETVEYSGKCKVTILGAIKEPIVAHYKFKDGNTVNGNLIEGGEVEILAPGITIEVLAGCNIVVPAAKYLPGITYENKPGTLFETLGVKASVKNINVENKCLGKNELGEYTGSSEATPTLGGEIEA